MDKKFDSALTREALERFSRDELISLNVALFNKVSSLEEQLAVSKELRLLANSEKYSPQTEQMEFLFPELEAIFKFCETLQAIKNQKTQTEEDVKTEEEKINKRKKRTHSLTAPADAPVVEIDHTDNAPDSVERDGILYKRGIDKEIFKVSYTKRKKIVEKHIYPTWRATVEVEGDEKSKIVGFSNVGLDALSCSSSLVAEILTKKFDDHLPLYRQSEIFERNGDGISRQLMCHWIMKYYEGLCDFDKYFGDQIFKMKMISQDETPLEVVSVKSPSGKISSSSFAIIRVGSTYDKEKHKLNKVIHVYYSNGRSRELLFDGFERNHYSGPLMTDGLKGYFNGPIDERKKCTCWVHAVRKLKKYVRLVKDDKSINKILYLHGQLYKIEETLRNKLDKGDISTDEFLDKRKKEAKPIIDEIYKVVDIANNPLKKDQRQEGLNYLIEYKKYLYHYLDFLEAAPDSNECERRAKAWATGRKNWLFCQTIDGADASCFFFSLVETAKENGLNPEDYLEYILTYGPCTSKDKYDTLLPWNVDMSRIEKLHEAKANAKPDPNRTKPYIFTGRSR